MVFVPHKRTSMEDIAAIKLILGSTKDLEELPSPPDNYNQIETYVQRCNKTSKGNIDRIAAYITTISDLLKSLTKVVNDNCKVFQESMEKALQRLKAAKEKQGFPTTEKQGFSPREKQPRQGMKLAVGTRTGKKDHRSGGQEQSGDVAVRGFGQNKEVVDDQELIKIVQDIATQNGLLQQLIAETNKCLASDISLPDLTNLESHLDALKRQTEKTCHVEEEDKRKKQKEVGKRKKEEEKRKSEEEKRKRVEEKRKREDEKRKKEEEKRKGKDKKRQSEEEKRKTEEEHRKREEEKRKQDADRERQRQEEEEERKKKEEDKQKQMEKESKEREEREKKEKQEEEEKKKKEEKEKRNQKQREEEDKRRKEENEIEKKKKEEEYKRKIDPKNWDFQIFQMGSVEVDDGHGHHEDNCCVISAVDGGLHDIRCNVAMDFSNFSDELDDSITHDDEKLASSVICVESATGRRITLQAPMQVFLPRVGDVTNSDDIVIKCSVDGGPWEEETPITPVKPVDGIELNQRSRLIGQKLNSFTNAKIVAVSRRKRETFSVGQVGGRKASGDVAITVPEGTFNQNTVIGLKVDPVRLDATESITNGSSYDTSVISVQFSNTPTNPVTIDLTGVPDNKQVATTSYTVLKDENNDWQFADTEVSENITSIKLPTGKKRFGMIRVRLPQEESCEKALHVASECYARVTYTPANLIIKQNTSDASQGIVQCVRSDDVIRTLDELLSLGYGAGPEESRVIYVREGTQIELTCTGNIVFVSERKVKKTLSFFANWRCRRNVSFGVKSKYFQRDASCFSGQVVSIFHRKPGTPGDDIVVKQVINLPKDGSIPRRKYGNLSTDLIALAHCLSYLLVHQCSSHWKVVLSKLCGGSKLTTLLDSGGLEQEQICKRAILDWIHSKPSQSNKFAAVKNVLDTSKYHELVEPITDFMDLCNGGGELSDEAVKMVAACVDRDLVEVAEDLMLSPEELNEFIVEFHDENFCEIAALISGWRFTDAAIRAGNGALSTLKTLLRI